MEDGICADGCYSSSWLTDRCAQAPGVSDGMISVVSILLIFVWLVVVADGYVRRERNLPCEARFLNDGKDAKEGSTVDCGRMVLGFKGCVSYNKSLIRIDRSALKFGYMLYSAGYCPGSGWPPLCPLLRSQPVISQHRSEQDLSSISAVLRATVLGRIVADSVPTWNEDPEIGLAFFLC